MMTDMYLGITNYDWTTITDHIGWPAVVSSGVFARWLILPCLVASKGVMFVFRSKQIYEFMVHS